MQSGFPDRLTTFDSVLARAEENRVYTMFRDRRRGGGWRRRAADLMSSGPAAYIRLILTVLLLGAGIAAALLVAWWLILLVPAVAMVGMRFGHAVPKDDRRMPMRVADVFSASGYHRGAALDLWLAGIRGREVLEAIYLERAARWPLWLAAYGIPSAYVLFRPSTTSVQWSPYHALFMIGAWYFLWQGAYLLHAILSLFRIWIDLAGRNAVWRGESRRVSGIAMMAARPLMLAFACFLILPCVVALLLPSPSQPHTMAFCGILLGILGFVIGQYVDDFQDSLYRGTERELRRADEAFDMFVCGTIMGEESGRAWARWVHHPARTAADKHNPVWLPTPSDFNWQMRQDEPHAGETPVGLPTIRYEEEAPGGNR